MTPHTETLRVQYVLLNISNLDRYVYFFGYVAEPKAYPNSPIKYYGNLSFPLSLPKIVLIFELHSDISSFFEWLYSDSLNTWTDVG